MAFKDDKVLLLQLLIIQSILIFIRTTIYILFDRNLLDLDRKIFGKSNKQLVEWILTVFAIIRLIIVSILFMKRGFTNDILSYCLAYLMFSSFLRFYYQYLTINHPTSKQIEFIDKKQDITSGLLFFVSLYIIKYVFF